MVWFVLLQLPQGRRTGHAGAAASTVNREEASEAVLRLTAYCKAAAALNTRRGGLKAKCNGVDVEDDEGSV